MQIKGEEYELKFNLKRVKLIEAQLGQAVAEAVLSHGGMMPINTVETFFAYGLKKAGEEVFVKPKEGVELCDWVIEEESYSKAVLAIQEAVKRDLGFLFRQ